MPQINNQKLNYPFRPGVGDVDPGGPLSRLAPTLKKNTYLYPEDLD